MDGWRPGIRIPMLGVLTVLAACARSLAPEQPEGRTAADAARLHMLVPAAGVPDCAGGFVEALAPTREGRPVLPVTLRPLDGVDPSAFRIDVEFAPPTDDADCLLVVDRVRPVGAGVRPLGVATVEAERVRERRRRTNPARRELEERLRELRRQASDADGGRILRTGEPTVDLVGLVAGAVLEAVGSLAGPEDEIAAIEERLAEIPRFVDEDVVERVPLTVERYEAVRRGSVRLALVHVRLGRTWRTEADVVERRRFAVLPPRSPSDLRLPTEPELVFVRDRTAIEDWRGGAPRPSLADLAEQLAEVVRGDGEDLPLAALEAEWGRRQDRESALADLSALAEVEPSAAPAATAYSPSVVVVRDGARPVALGFQVAPEYLLTPARTLPATTLVPVEVAPGLVTYGLVESRDDAADLALLWTPRRGEPLPLGTVSRTNAEPRRLRPVVEVRQDLPGTPLLGTDGVVGMVRAAGPPAAVTGVRELRRFLLRARERDGVAAVPLSGD